MRAHAGQSKILVLRLERRQQLLLVLGAALVAGLLFGAGWLAGQSSTPPGAAGAGAGAAPRPAVAPALAQAAILPATPPSLAGAATVADAVVATPPSGDGAVSAADDLLLGFTPREGEAGEASEFVPSAAGHPPELEARVLAALGRLRSAELQLPPQPAAEEGEPAAVTAAPAPGEAPAAAAAVPAPASVVAAAGAAPPAPGIRPAPGAERAGAVRPRRAAQQSKTRYTLQVSAFQDREEANELIQLLRSHGHNPYLMISEVPERGRWYRVRLGKFSERKAAEAFQARFELQEKIRTYISPL